MLEHTTLVQKRGVRSRKITEGLQKPSRDQLLSQKEGSPLPLFLFLFLIWWHILLILNHPQNSSFLIANDVVIFLIY